MTSAMIVTIPALEQDEEEEEDEDEVETDEDGDVSSFTSAKICSVLLDLRMIHLATGQPSRVLLSPRELETRSNLISLPLNPDLNSGKKNNIEDGGLATKGCSLP